MTSKDGPFSGLAQPDFQSIPIWATSARDQMYASIDNLNGQVEYATRAVRLHSARVQLTNNFNCEHTFPQSFYNSNVPMRSDIHQLPHGCHFKLGGQPTSSVWLPLLHGREDQAGQWSI